MNEYNIYQKNCKKYVSSLRNCSTPLVKGSRQSQTNIRLGQRIWL